MKQSAKLSVLLLLAGISGCAYFNTFYNAKKHYSTAYNLTQKRITGKLSSNEITNYDKAIEKATKLLDQYPESRYVDDAFLLLGKSYYFKSEYRRSIEQLNNLREIFPQSDLNLEGNLYRAKALLELKEYASADSTLQQLMSETKSRDIKAKSNLIMGDILSKGKNFAQAIEYYKQAVDFGLGNEKSSALFKIASAYDTLHVNDKAAEYFLLVEKAEPSWEMLFESKFRYAISLRKLGEIDRAVDLFDRLLVNEKYKNRFGEIKLEIANCVVKKEDWKAAISTYQDIIQNHPKTIEAAEAYYRLGDLYEREMFDFERAVACYHQVSLENRQFSGADSARIKELDIQRKMALEDVILMADNGEDGSVDLQSIIAASDSLAKMMLAEMDTVNQNTQQHSNDPDKPGDDARLDAARQNSPGQQTTRPAAGSRNGGDIYHASEIDKNLFQLAELYLLRFAAPDSALHLYHRIITEFSDSPFHVRALYNSGYIAKKFLGDDQLLETYFSHVIEEYPLSEYAQKARSELGIPSGITDSGVLLNKFLEAEELLWDENEPGQAYEKFNELLSEAPDSNMAGQILYVMAYIQESCLGNTDLARTLYDSLASSYPKTDYGVKSKKKLDAKLPVIEKEGTESAGTSAGIIASEPEIKDSLDVAALIVKNEGLEPGEKADFKEEAVLHKQGPIDGIEAINKYLVFPNSIPKNQIPDSLDVKVRLDLQGKIMDVQLVENIKNKVISNIVINAVKNLRFYPPLKNEEKPENWVFLTIPLTTLPLKVE